MPTVDEIVSAYDMDAADIAALEAAIFEQLRTAWLQRLTEVAAQHGRTDAHPTLSAVDEAVLRKKAHDDAQSIADTYQRELENQVERMCAENPDADGEEYAALMGTWITARNERKGLEIGLNVVTTMVSYAMLRFISENHLEDEMFIAVGAPPVCPFCVEIVSWGVVDYQTTQDWFLPLHPQCSHSWEVVRASMFAENDPVWVGG